MSFQDRLRRGKWHTLKSTKIRFLLENSDKSDASAVQKNERNPFKYVVLELFRGKYCIRWQKGTKTNQWRHCCHYIKRTFCNGLYNIDEPTTMLKSHWRSRSAEQKLSKTRETPMWSARDRDSVTDRRDGCTTNPDVVCVRSRRSSVPTRTYFTSTRAWLIAYTSSLLFHG